MGLGCHLRIGRRDGQKRRVQRSFLRRAGRLLKGAKLQLGFRFLVDRRPHGRYSRDELLLKPFVSSLALGDHFFLFLLCQLAS